MDSLDTIATEGSVVDNEPFRLRSYQAEMVEESLEKNIIVVMDTGSGKTHIAIERTRAELETCRPDKLVWFLAPTVTLCEQQYEVFKSNLPGFGIQILSGNDNVDHWRDQGTWDAVLSNVRVVVSTYQVLLDALAHAFVRMGRVALLIFDEAHHCSLKHPAHGIMSDFYEPFLHTGDGSDPPPKILGLSASPVKKAAATKIALEHIERNLQATARTPKLHRSELIQFVHKPELIQVDYPTPLPSEIPSPLLLALKDLHISYKIGTDPYLLDLLEKKQSGYNVSKPLEKLFLSGKTDCRDQLRTLAQKASDTADELGVSAMEWYVYQCVAQFRENLKTVSHQQLFDTTVQEKKHLMGLLESLPLSTDMSTSSFALSMLSRKVDMLIDILVRESKADPEFTALVFVEQRVWVAILAQILATHPRTQGLIRIGTFVGTSKSSKRKTNIANFVEPRNQQTTLEDFRAGRTNLILTTSVLEEGIDISNCNLVICFERPKSLKSFVQRRGRARKQRSKYLIFTPEGTGARSTESWQSLEAEMRRAYEDDMRLIEKANERETTEEEVEGHEFRVPNTGALLTLASANQHLSHFCAVSTTSSFVDTRPQFDFVESRAGRITAEVRLPISIDQSLRKARGSKSWVTEKMARKDAAFEAYMALYRAGLINDNLLPIRQTTSTVSEGSDRAPSIIEVSSLFDPWHRIALYQQQQPHTWCRTLITLRMSGDPVHMILLTPVPLPVYGSETTMYWNQTMRYHVSTSWLSGVILSTQEVHTLRSITLHLLHSVFHGRMHEKRDDFLWLLAPCDSSTSALDTASLSTWASTMRGHRSLSDLVESGQFDTSECGLISTPGDSRKFLLNTEPSNYSTRSDVPVVWVNRFPKRRDFLHPVLGDVPPRGAEQLRMSECIVDNVPTRYSVFTLLVPSIIHKIGCDFIADQLRTTILSPLSFEPSSLPMLVKALTSSSTDEVEDYQNLEFYGDCVLKFVASLHLMAANLKEPESFLTQRKGRLVSNGSLARASVAAGLDQFVMTTRFTGAKWQPRLLSDTLTVATAGDKRMLSSKLVADVVESAIGVSFVTGGFPKAFTCIQTLLPLECWIPMDDANEILFEAAESGSTMTGLSMLESLTGHTFHKKHLLLDALTHASYLGPNANASWERLEFLGDAVLDYLITKRLYEHEPQPSHRTMHAIRTAMVNASYLAFRMFETTVNEDLVNKATFQTEVHSRALWQFMRSGAPQVAAARELAHEQHQQARDQILTALGGDTRYPWHLLALTDPPKFLSDIVESVLGAIYVDSRGDFAACEAFVQRLGILEDLRRILRDIVDCLHPKERLGHLAVEKVVKYAKVDADEGDVACSKGTYRCQVLVGGVRVATPVEGLKKLNAETIAATVASQVLETATDVSMSDTEEEDEFVDAEEGGGIKLDSTRVSWESIGAS